MRRDRNIIRQRYYEGAIRHVFSRLRARHQLIEVPENRLFRVGWAIAEAYGIALNDAMDVALAVGHAPLVIADEAVYLELQQIAHRRPELELLKLQEVSL